VATQTYYGSNVASTTLATNVCKLSNTTGGTETQTTATTGPSDTNSNEFVQIKSKGGSSTGAASIATPTDGTAFGWLLDDTSLEGGSFATGNWSGVTNIIQSSVGSLSTGVSMVLGLYKRSSGGVYTLIGSITTTGVSLTGSKQQITFAATSFSTVSFAVGDKLYIHRFVKGGSFPTSFWGSDAFKEYVSNSGTQGVANDLQITTPNFTPAGLTKLRISDGYGGLFQ